MPGPPPFFRRQGPLTSVFSPSAISNLDMWFRADSLITEVLGKITTWGNLGTRGPTQNLIQGNPVARPTRIVSDPDFNSQASIRFDNNAAGTINSNIGTVGYTLSNGNNVEIWAILRQDADPAPVGNQSGALLIGGATTLCNLPWTDGIIYDGNLRSSSFYTTVNPATSLATTCLYTVASDSVTWQNYLNGTLLATRTASFGFPSSLVTIDVGFSRGSFRMNGRIAEICVYNKTLSATERTDLKAYFSNRYGITIV